MEPALDGSDDLVGIGGLGERSWLAVVPGEETVDGGLEVDSRVEDAAFRRPFDWLAKKPTAALSHEQEVGVKWKVRRL